MVIEVFVFVFLWGHWKAQRLQDLIGTKKFELENTPIWTLDISLLNQEIYLISRASDPVTWPIA